MKSSRPESAHCRSSKTRITGSDRRHALEEQPPAAEQVGAVGVRALLEPQQVRQARLDEAALALVGHVLLDRRAQLLARARRRLLLDDPRARAHHLGQRPVRDALAVGQAAALVPPAALLDAVEVLEVLPQQARLAGARLADDGHVTAHAVARAAARRPR